MKTTLKKLFHFCVTVLRGYRDDDCSQFAAVISFYAIFSIPPLAIIAVVSLVHLLGFSADLIERFETLIVGILPVASDALREVIGAALSKRPRLGFVSTGILVLIASFLVSALERALDRVFRAEKKRNYFHSKIVAIGFVFVFIVLFAAPAVLSMMQGTLVRVGLGEEHALLRMSGDVFFFFVAFAAFFLSATVIPNHKVYMRYSFLGAILFTALTSVARPLFRYYIRTTWDRYDFIYDSLTILIVMIIWIYYLANIFLLSAEYVARLQERRRT